MCDDVIPEAVGWLLQLHHTTNFQIVDERHFEAKLNSWRGNWMLFLTYFLRVRLIFSFWYWEHKVLNKNMWCVISTKRKVSSLPNPVCHFPLTLIRIWKKTYVFEYAGSARIPRRLYFLRVRLIFSFWYWEHKVLNKNMWCVISTKRKVSSLPNPVCHFPLTLIQIWKKTYVFEYAGSARIPRRLLVWYRSCIELGPGWPYFY